MLKRRLSQLPYLNLTVKRKQRHQPHLKTLHNQDDLHNQHLQLRYHKLWPNRPKSLRPGRPGQLWSSPPGKLWPIKQKLHRPKGPKKNLATAKSTDKPPLPIHKEKIQLNSNRQLKGSEDPIKLYNRFSTVSEMESEERPRSSNTFRDRSPIIPSSLKFYRLITIHGFETQNNTRE